MKREERKWMALPALATVLMSCVSAFAATECVWVGGSEGDPFVDSNWDPVHVPSSENYTAYIAVFTNSVTLTPSSTYFYLSGIVVSNNAAVNYSAQRITASTVCENKEFVVDIEEGSSFTIASTLVIFQGRSDVTLVKKGKGTLSAAGWFGHYNATGRFWGGVDIQEGEVDFSSKENFSCIDGTLRIRSGAIGKLRANSAFGSSTTTGCRHPRIQVDEGGVLDANGKTFKASSIAGAGVITNCSNTVTLNLRHSGETFSGRILGGGTLAVTPEADVTTADAKWIVGAADALWGVSLVRNALEGYSYEVLFVSDVDTFYAKAVPTDAPCFDTNGVPVEVARSGNFWYVDCGREGAAGDGKSLATAFQTLSEAMNNSSLAAGDTVWVAPGVYSSGTMASTSVNLSNRVTVAADVRLVSLEGAERTAIVGADATLPVEDGYGVGAGAVRCVKLGARSTLRGFTLRGGRTYSTSKSGQGDANVGGGIHAEESSIVIDCVISNCVATRGGGAYRGNYFNCRFDANRATESWLVGAHILNKASLYNCVLTGALGGCDWYGNQTDSFAVNCTFGTNGNGSTRGTSSETGKHIAVYNSLLLAAPASSSCDEFNYCVVSPKGSSSATFDANSIATNLTAATSPTVYAFAGIDKNTLKPRKSSSILVGAADLATYRSLFPVAQYWLSEYDVDFKKRIWGDSLDIGAFAYDRNRPIPGLMLMFK